MVARQKSKLVQQMKQKIERNEMKTSILAFAIIITLVGLMMSCVWLGSII